MASDNQTILVFTIICLCIGGVSAVGLGIMYSINNTATPDVGKIISTWWWIVVYIMFGGFGLATAGFAIMKFR